MAASVPVPPRTRGRSVTGITLAAVGVVLAILATIFVAFILVIHGFDQESDAAARAENVLQASGALERSVIDVETGLRGYLLTEDPSFLAPYDRARNELPGLEARLRTLTTDPTQRSRAAGILGATQEFVTGYAEPLRRAGGEPDLDAVLHTGKAEV